jgi:hypothetical protein
MINRRIDSSERGAYGALFAAVRRRWFRLETLQEYDAAGESAAMAAFRAGDRSPFPVGDWQRMITDHVAHGRELRRVHVVREPWSDYIRWELHGYPTNQAAGEQIRIIPVGEADEWPATIPEGLDFWVLDDDVWVMEYDHAGRWLYCEPVDPAEAGPYLDWMATALEVSIPLDAYHAGRLRSR